MSRDSYLTKLTLLLRDKKKISVQEFELLKQDWRSQLYDLGGLRLIDVCTSILENKVEEINNRKYFASINKMRRCIVHRSGVVSGQDVDDSGVLQVTILKPELLAGDVVIDKMPFKLGAGETLNLRSVEETLTWKTGQSIEPTIRDCLSIGWSLIWFCSEVNKKLGQTILNVIASNPESFGTQAQKTE